MRKTPTKILFRKFDSGKKLESFANKFGEDKEIVKREIKVFYHPKTKIVFYFLILEYTP